MKAEDWSEVSVSRGTPKIAGNHQKLGESSGRNTHRLSRPQEEPPTPANTLTPGSQDCETISFCYFKPPSSWRFVLAALGH